MYPASVTTLRLFRRASTLALLLGALTSAGCSTDVSTPVNVGIAPNLTDDPTRATFDPSLGVDLSLMTRTASGLYLRDLTVGTGATATAGRTASVHYTGSFVTGVKFDSSRDRGRPFSFLINTGAVIRGWDEGVQGMRVGGRRQLVIPPSLGYGATGSGPIPGGTILVFDIELLGIQ